jgi:hypothetical protein
LLQYFIGGKLTGSALFRFLVVKLRRTLASDKHLSRINCENGKKKKD